MSDLDMNRGGSPAMGGAPQTPPPVSYGMNQRMQRVPYAATQQQAMPYSAPMGGGPNMSMLARFDGAAPVQALPQSASPGMQPGLLNQYQNAQQGQMAQNPGAPFSGKGGIQSPQGPFSGKGGVPSGQGKTGTQSYQGPFAGKMGNQSNPKFGGPGGSSGKFGSGSNMPPLSGPPMNGLPVSPSIMGRPMQGGANGFAPGQQMPINNTPNSYLQYLSSISRGA